MHNELNADIVIIGGSTGGCAAALAALKAGKRVIMTEETDWIGGQLTSQAVPPDEHFWIEKFGCTRSYRQFRDNVRSYYKRNFPLTEAAQKNVYFNPGSAIVSRICHDPRVGLAVLEETFAPYVHSQQLTILLNNKAERVDVCNNNIKAVTVTDLRSNDKIILTAQYFLDATECGDLLPLAGVEYVSGSESAKDTGEPHALPGAPDPLDIQSVTFCFAMDYLEGENHVIDKPEDYDFWSKYHADFWPDKQLSWTYSQPRTLEPTQKPLFLEPGMDQNNWSLWHYRRLIDKTNFMPGTFRSDITLVNWPQTDYWLGPVYEADPETCRKNLKAARQLSLSLLYWMQTEAPRSDGGYGYPGLRLRKDVVGTSDGLAKYPYIRESRRIKAEFTILEQHLNAELRQDKLAETYDDSVGIGYYHIDIHPSSGGRNYIDVPSLPFQIPLGSLIPVRIENLLPACKNIGTTHITNGCYRLHPVEWNIGEAAGYLSAFSLNRNVSPRAVRNQKNLLEEFQGLLLKNGIDLAWPKDL